MSGESRFGINLNSLSAILRSGVTSKSKVNEIRNHLHTSDEGLPSFPAHISLRQSTYGTNALSSLTVTRLSYSTLLKKSFVNFEPLYIRNLVIIMSVLEFLGAIIAVIAEPEDVGGPLWKHAVFVVLTPAAVLLHRWKETLLAIVVESTIRYRKQGKLEEFLNRLVSTSTQKPLVKRDGSLLPLPLEDIVVGDICHLKSGDVVPGDGLLLETKDIKFKSEVTSNEGVFCSAGSLVSEGTGVLMIVAVGPNTQISYLVNEPSPSKKLFNASFILYLAILLGVFTFLINLMHFSINTYIIDANSWQLSHLQKIVEFIVYGLNTIGLTIPWFLPLVIVLSIHYAQRTPGPLSETSVKATSLSNVLKFLQFILVVNILLVIFHPGGVYTCISGIQGICIFLSTNILAVALFPSDSPRLEESKDFESSNTSDKIAECVKNVMGQLIFQLAILTFLVGFGAKILDFDAAVEYGRVNDGPSTIATMAFNTLTLMSFCNLFNCRKIKDERDQRERNICSGMLQHPKTWFFLILMFILQATIVQMGGLAFTTRPLKLEEWLICIFLGLSVLVWGQLLMCITGDKCMCCCRKNQGEQAGSRAAIYADNSAVTAV